MRKKRGLTDLMRRMSGIVYPAMCEEYTKDCCIAAASVLRRVFQLYGYAAEPVPVGVEIFNAAMTKLIISGMDFPDDPKERMRLWDVTGAWGIGINAESAKVSAANGYKGYGGHLLVRVQGIIVDATIQQAERPARNMLMPPMIVAPANALMRERVLELNVGDCRLVYRLLGDHSYRTAPDWLRRTTPYPETVNKIIQRIEAANESTNADAAD
jgi:hypothetical protein